MTLGLFGRVTNRIKRQRDKRSFDRGVRGILSSRPLQPQGDSPLLLSMVCHRDVIAYLLAIKSLYTRVEQGRVVIINDGSLTLRDLAILRHHIPGLEVLDIGTISTGSCPPGGTWERLIKIIELSASHYVIQADADILVSAPIPEVVRCWQENRSFLLGTDAGQEISTAQDTADMVQGWITTNNWGSIPAALEAEALLHTLPDDCGRSYVHASSGFAGFARGMFSIADLERFSTHMSQKVGVERWRQLGTEQIASNYILANAPGATVLPFPRYACFEPHLISGEYALLHFIGSYRYDAGVYRQRSTEFLVSYNSSENTTTTYKGRRRAGKGQAADHRLVR